MPVNVVNVLTATGNHIADEHRVFIAALDADEYAAVPKYMRGSLSLDDVNLVVDRIDAMLREKNTLMRTAFRKLSKSDKDRCISWREQEVPETANRLFIVDTELRTQLTTKQFGYMRKIVPILRHCRRIVEIRCKGLTRLTVYQ